MMRMLPIIPYYEEDRLLRWRSAQSLSYHPRRWAARSWVEAVEDTCSGFPIPEKIAPSRPPYLA